MIPREALAVLELVEIEWPNADRLPDETKKAWAFELMEFEIDAAREAVRDLARFQKFRPALSELLDACYEQQKLRRAKEAMALPAGSTDYCSFGDWLRDYATEEQKASVARLSPKLVAYLKENS